MRMPEDGPLGETFFEASERAMTGALLVKRSLGGWVESVVTLRTQRRREDVPAAVFAWGFREAREAVRLPGDLAAVRAGMGINAS